MSALFDYWPQLIGVQGSIESNQYKALSWSLLFDFLGKSGSERRIAQEKYEVADTSKDTPESPTSDLKLYGLRAHSSFGPGSFSHKSFRALADQDPDIKRIVSYRGRLSIKVSHVTL